MEVTKIMDSNIFVGVFGLTFSQLISIANGVLGVFVAFATLVYLIIKIYKLVKTGKEDS